MNRISREPSLGGRNLNHQHSSRNGIAVGGRMLEWDERLDLFSRIQHQQPVTNLRNEPKANIQSSHTKSERPGVGSLMFGRGKMDDLFSSDAEKNDYDWLLTPPETPLLASPEAQSHKSSSVLATSCTPVRSVSASKVSRFSAPQADKASSYRPARSSSTTPSSVSKTNSISSYLSTDRNSVLNTSTASVTSKPSNLRHRSTATSTARTTPTPATRTTPSRSTTPIKNRQTLASPGEKSRPSPNSRPATPTPRPATPTSRPKTPSKNYSPTSTTSVIQINSRPSTPTRQKPQVTSPNTIGGKPVCRVLETNDRKTATASQANSPARRPRTPVQQFSMPDFPLDVPPNLRTKIPERAVSASRQRPGMSVTTLLNSNSGTTAAVISSNRRQSSSPVSTRGRQDNLPNSRSSPNFHELNKLAEKKKSATETVLGRQIKPSVAPDSNGLGRTTIKKSVDMPAKTSDTRQSIGARGNSVFPHSIRSTALRSANKVESNGLLHALVSDNSSNSSSSRKGHAVCNAATDVAVKDCMAARSLTKLDIYESSRYDAMLLKEDVKNMSWLHSIDDKPDQGPLFDLRFVLLPEPFSMIR